VSAIGIVGVPYAADYEDDVGAIWEVEFGVITFNGRGRVGCIEAHLGVICVLWHIRRFRIVVSWVCWRVVAVGGSSW
jgi:hypothetical protein